MEELFPYDATTDEGLAMYGSPDMFTMMMVTYVKGIGISIRSVIVPGSRIDLYMDDMQNSGICDCHPGMGWELTAIDPEPGCVRVIKTMTLDTHVAMQWMRCPQAMFEMDLEGMETTEEVVFVPEGEALTTVVNDYNGSLDGSITMSDLGDLDQELNKFFEKGDE